MLSAFNNLENKLEKELQSIRQLLVLIQHQHIGSGNDDNTKQMISTNSNVLSAIATSAMATTTPTFLKLQPIPHENKNSANNATTNYYMYPKYKSLQNKKEIRSNISLTALVREREVSMFNNTLLTDKDIKVFTYYWRMENFTTKIKNENSISVDSPIFSIKGISYTESIKVFNKRFLCR